jgi:hypothetical protein
MKHSILGAACASLFITLSGAAQAASVSGQGTWESTLQGRDLNGNGLFDAYYDTTLNITWLANANYAGTTMTWSAANAWAAGLTLGGYTEWRLPTTTDTGTSGCNYSTTGGTDCGYNVDTGSSEMASMYYDTLGNLAYYDTSGVGPQPGWGLSNTGPFSNVQSTDYWSATEYAPGTGSAWGFSTGIGDQFYDDKAVSLYAWAVHTGDVGASAVPIPAAAWLFGSGLLGLIGVSRKRRS